MCPGSSVLITISVLVLSVLSLPLNIDWSTLKYDSDSIAQNEKILKLSLQLAVHTADRLMRLRNETDNDHNCKHNDNLSLSTTEVIMTQLSSQADLEQLDKEFQNRSVFDDSQINNNNRIPLENLDHNQTSFLYSTQSQELFNSRDVQESVSDRNFIRNLNLKANNLILKSMQNVPNTSSDLVGHNHEVSSAVILQKPILDSNTASNSLNINEFNSDARNSQSTAIDGISERLLNSKNPIKNISNATFINDLTEIVNKFLPRSKNLQESTLGMSQRLYSTDLAKNVPSIKIMSDLLENVNQHIPWPSNTQEPSDKIDGVSQRFLDPTIIKNFGDILNPQVVNNLPAVSRILSNTKNIVESVIKALPKESIRNTSNSFNQIIPQSQNITNVPFKIIEKNQGYLPNFSSAQHQQIGETAKQAENKTDNLIRDHQNLIRNSSNVDEENASERDTQETRDNSLPVNADNLKAQNNDQFVSTSPIGPKGPSIPLLRSLSDFNEHKKAKNNFSSIQTNETDTNNSTDEKLSIRNHQEIDPHLDQINEELKSEGFEKMREIRTDYKEKQPNPILEDLSQVNGNSGLKNTAVEITSSNRLEFAASTISSAMKHYNKSSNSMQDLQDSGNVNDAVKSDLEKLKKFRDNLSGNDNINESIRRQNTRVDNHLSELNSYSHFSDDLKDENLHKQLSETNLREMSEQLINALRPIIEKGMVNSRNHMIDHYSGRDKNLASSNVAF